MACKRCNSSIKVSGYCSNTKCPFTDWPQNIKFSDLITMSTIDIELKYELKKRASYNDNVSLTIQEWDKAERIRLLESFIDSYGLKREFMEFVDKMSKKKRV